MKPLLLAFATLIAQPAAPAPWLTATAEVSPPEGGELVVGSTFSLVVEARHPPGGVALLPEGLPLPDGLAERLPQRRHVRRTEGDVEIDAYHLELLALDTGDLEIPALKLAFSSTEARTAPVTVTVGSGLLEEERAVASSTIPQALAELERMAAPNPTPRTILVEDHRPLWAAATLLGALFAALLILYVVRRVRRAARPLVGAEAPPPPRPAHEVALERLEALRTQDLLAKRDFKGFYIELSEILRWYVGAQYDFESVELTVAELSAELAKRRTPGLDLAHLRRVLDEADLVKFAKYAPDEVHAHAALNAAFEVVERTTPRGPVEEDGHAA